MEAHANHVQVAWWMQHGDDQDLRAAQAAEVASKGILQELHGRWTGVVR